MATQTRYNNAFISYSRKDSAFVHRLVEVLDRDYEIWVDFDDIAFSEDWWAKIKEGIESADNFVFVISPDSVESAVCRDEIDQAVINGKRIVPILHRPIEGRDLMDTMHPAIKQHNWLPFKEMDNFEADLQRLIQTLDTDYEYVREHTRLLTRAQDWEGSGRDPGLLLAGNAIQQAQDFLTNAEADGKQPPPAALHFQFIQASRKQQIDLRRRTLAAVSTIALLGSLVAISLILFIRATDAERRAVASANEAEREADVSSSLALASLAQQTENRLLSSALAFAAGQVQNPPPRVERVLADAFYAPGVTTRLVDPNMPPGEELLAVAAQPDSDLVAAASDDRLIIVWDSATGEFIRYLGDPNLRDPAIGHIDAVNKVAFDTQGTHLYSAGDDRVALKWDFATGQIEQRFRHADAVISLALSPDGRQLLTGTEAARAYLWDTQSGDLIQLLDRDFDEAIDEPVTAVAFDDRGGRMMLGLADGSVLQFTLPDFELRYELGIFEDEITDIIFDGPSVLIAGEDRIQRVNLRDEQIIEEFVGHTGYITDMELSRDAGFLISASEDGDLRLWDSETGQLREQLSAHVDWVNGVALGRNARAISVSSDGQGMVWSLAVGNISAQFAGHDGQTNAVALGRNGVYAVSGGTDRRVNLWEVNAGGTLTEPLAWLDVHDDTVTDVEFVADDTRVVSTSVDGQVCIWEWQAGTHTCHKPHGESGVTVHSIAINSAGTHAVSGASDGSVLYWEIATGEVIHNLIAHQLNSFTTSDKETNSVDVLAVAITPDDQRALSASRDGTMVLWSLTNGTVLNIFSAEGASEFHSLAIHPDGKQALSGTREGEILWWDLTLGRLILRLRGHSNSVTSLSYSPDGSTALSASADLSILLWRPEQGDAIREFVGHERGVLSAVMSTDGRTALSGGADGAMFLWRVDDLDALLSWLQNNREVRHLSEEECNLYGVDCDYTIDA